MLYSFAKILMTAGLRFFYRHLYVTGLENIPAKGPAIIIANHNSSLMDAALLGILLKRKAWFFARGDVFVNKPVQKLLWWLHMIPVHSHQDGKKSLGVNRDGFLNGRQILSAGGIVVFFPESYSHIEHQLLPFRKGVFRLAFDTADAHQFSFEIPIIPVGISYDDPVACRSEAQVHVGRPLLVTSYKEEYQKNQAAALLHICKDAYRSVSGLVLHVAHKDRLPTAGQHLVVCRNNTAPAPAAWKINSIKKLLREQKVCDDINQTSAGKFDTRKQEADAYFPLLTAASITDKTVATSRSFPFWKKICLFIGFPCYAAGLLLNGLPVLIGRVIADKKVSRKDFYSWIFIACTAVSYLLWIMILMIVVFLINWRYAAILLMVIIASGLFAYAYKDWQYEFSQQKRWERLMPDNRQQLISMRAVIQQPVQL